MEDEVAGLLEDALRKEEKESHLWECPYCAKLVRQRRRRCSACGADLLTQG